MVRIEQEGCIGCGQCVRDCPVNNIKLEDGKANCVSKCFLCGHCVAICPKGVISIPDYDMSDVESYDEERFAFDINNLIHTIKLRRSIRRYQDKPVENSKLENIIQAGRYTATAINRQACHFIVVQDKLDDLKRIVWDGIDKSLKYPESIPPEVLAQLKNLDKMRSKGTDFLFQNAPVVLYILAENTVDAGLAAQNMELAAISQGLGVLYNGYLSRATSLNKDATDWINTKDKPIAVCMLIGYPKSVYKRSAPRKPANLTWL